MAFDHDGMICRDLPFVRVRTISTTSSPEVREAAGRAAVEVLMIEREMSRRGVLKGAAAVAVAAGVGITGTAGPASAHSKAGSVRRAADTVVMNGKVLVMDRRRRRAQAIAIKNGRTVAVGSDREISRLAGRGTQVVDAAGGTVLPGINDGHFHFSGFGTEASLFGFEPPREFTINVDKPTAAEIAAAVGSAASRAATADSWIRGGGWNGNILDALPTRDVLDPVSGDHPVILSDFSHHAAAVNSKALQIAGITRDTVPPVGGVIEKDVNGEPTGILREGAVGLVQRVVPPYSQAELSEAMDFAIQVAHSLGITSLTDPGVGLETVKLYTTKLRQGALPLRVNLMLAAGPSLGTLKTILDGFTPLRGIDPQWLRVGEVKIMGDGIPTEARTAWLHEPYLDGSNGRLNVAGSTIAEQVATLKAMIATAAKRRFQIGTHATGDATIDTVVAGYLATNTKPRRHYVIHGDLTPVNTLRTMARHDIGVSFNPTIKALLGTSLYPVLGEERTNYQWPFRTALDLGVKSSSASDAAVVTPDWMVGVAGAVTRESLYGGGVAGEAERITVEESLTSYTRTPAWQDHAETWKGTLREGYVGDVCVLDGDILRTDPREIPGLNVAATLVGGQVVYDVTSSSSRAARAAASAVSNYRHDRSADCLQIGSCCCNINEKRLAYERLAHKP
jgi:predicted amidohydrolase YtcJ